MTTRRGTGKWMGWAFAVLTAVWSLAVGACFSDKNNNNPGTPVIGINLPDSGLPDVTIDANTPLYAVGGTVQGLVGTGLVLEGAGMADNLSASEDIGVKANNGMPVTFAFPTKVPSGTTYTVTVKTQPTNPTQHCVVVGGTGTVVMGDTTSLSVNCTTDQFAVSGTVAGLLGTTGLTLQNNGGDALNINANGSFAFAKLVASGAMYSVTVTTQPTNPTQTCSVTMGTASGTVGSSNVTTVQVICQTTQYAVGGTVSGLSGSGLVLQDNGGDDLHVTANGPFQFASKIASGTAFAVTIKTQPSSPAQACSVTGATGNVGAADVTSVVVNCSTTAFTVGGTVVGLTGAGLQLLSAAGGTPLAVGGSGSFAFPPVPSGTMYNVTVSTQPGGIGQTCAVTNGMGTVQNANVTSVLVTCSTDAYSLGGTVSGLMGTGLVLQDNGGNPLAISGNGPFTFPGLLMSGTSFDVTVRTEPSGPQQRCGVVAGVGMMGAGPVNDILVQCTQVGFFVGGTVGGLVGSGLVLANGADTVHPTADGPFVFPTTLMTGATYNVTVATQPANQTCIVVNPSGTIGTLDVSTVAVYCSQYTVGVSVAGLGACELAPVALPPARPANVVQLTLNGGAPLNVTASGAYTFAGQFYPGFSYSVGVSTQPCGQVCTVGANGSGQIQNADVSAAVTCSCASNSVHVTVTADSQFNFGNGVTISDSNRQGTSVLVTNSSFARDDAGVPIPYQFQFNGYVTCEGYNIVANPSTMCPACCTSYTCTVSNGSGSFTGSDVSVDVSCTTTQNNCSG